MDVIDDWDDIEAFLVFGRKRYLHSMARRWV